MMRKTALITAIAGGALSVFLMIHAGHYTMPPLLIVLIGMWVLLPYDALTLGNILSQRWSSSVSGTLYRLTFFITLVSVVVYAVAAFGQTAQKPAFFFVVIPPLSLALIGILLFIARSRSRHDAH